MLDKYGYSESVLEAVSKDHMLIKEAKSSKEIRQSHIVIVSKNTRDSHYESYIYSFGANKDGKDMQIVSYFMKELYLGRYLIKRNYYFLDKKDAESMFEDLESETERVRDEYYDGKYSNSEVPVTIQNYLSDKSGDIEDEENSIGTTVKKQIKDESGVRDWFGRGKEIKTEDNSTKKESGVTQETYLNSLKSAGLVPDMVKTAGSESTEEKNPIESEVQDWHNSGLKLMENWRESSVTYSSEEQHVDLSIFLEVK